MKPQHEWQAEWTGSYPCHCYGEWHLYRDGEEVDLEAIGCPFIEADAGTFGHYRQWRFLENWEEEWYYVPSGLGQKKWCAKNADWLRKLDTPFDWREIYKAFREHDWRSGCCGGCI